jgi:hypothetical protein
MGVLHIPAAWVVSLTSRGFGGLDPTAQVLIAVIPLTAIVLLATLAFFFLLWEYRKQKALIESGGAPVRTSRMERMEEKLLLIGIVALFVGVGLTVFFALHSGLSNSLLGGLMPTMAGLGLVTYFVVIRHARN